MGRKSLHPSAAAEALMREQLATMRAGTYTRGHVEVRYAIQFFSQRMSTDDLAPLAMKPEDIPLGYYTHINFAFALIDPQSFRIAPMDDQTASLYKDVTGLKNRQAGLEVWIAIGGWAMNDPGPMRTTFSDLAKSESAQDAFFESLLTFMIANGFDGVDLDWEYPVTDDRGGIPEDFDNYANFLSRLRNRLNSSGRRWGLTITLVSSFA
ncbi:MAG: hypothetical protein Q9200_004417 [Gallowayella weberi]